MRKRDYMFVVALLVTVLITWGCGGSDDGGTGVGNGTDDDGFKTTTAGGITLKWKVEGDDLQVKVSAATTGWVAVGFDPANRMQGANFIIGYVSGDDVFIRDDYGSGPTAHLSDTSAGGSDDVTDEGGTEADGTTEITFTIPLDSGDSLDRVLVEGSSYTVLLGRGPNGADNFTAQHGARTSTTITI